MKPGPKEQQIAELRKRKALPKHVDLMLADGAPAEIIILPGDPRGKPAPAKKKTGDAGVSLAPPLSIQKAIAADLADDDAKPLDVTARAMIEAVDGPKKQGAAAAEKEKTMTTKKEKPTKKAAATKARTPVKTPTTKTATTTTKTAPTTGRPDGLREGSQQAKLLDAAVAAGAEGATEAELCKKLGGWKKCASTLRRVCEKVGAKCVRTNDGRFVVTLKKAA